MSGGITVSNKGDHYAPQLVTSEDEGVIVTWFGWDSTSNYSQIYIQKYSNKGVALWNSGKPVQVSPGKGYDCQYPMIVNDKHNGAYLTWMRYDTNLSASSPDIFLQHIDSTGKVATGWNAIPATVSAIPGLREYYPHLALSPDGKSVYVGYGVGLVGSTALVLKRFHAYNGAQVINAGWRTGGDTISPGGQVYPDVNHDLWVYTDNSNNVVLTWIEARITGNGEVYMQQMDSNGNVFLGFIGTYIAGNTVSGNGVDYLQEVKDADGNLLLSFNNLDVFNDVEAMKVKPDGTILWQDTNITKNGKSAYPMPVSDGNKGMFIFYVYTSSPQQLHGIALDSAGKLYPGWTLPGPGFGEVDNQDPFEPNYDINAAMTSKGDAVVAWNKIKGSLFNMYVCNLLSNKSTCTNNPAAIDEVGEGNENVVLYPNPNNGSFQLGIRNGQLGMNANVEVYNMLGEKIFSKQLAISNGQLTIDLGTKSPGVYMYRMISERGEARLQMESL